MNEGIVSAYDLRGTAETGLTLERAWNIGKALAEWLPTAGSVAVVYAPSQEEIAKAVIEGVRLQGRGVVDGGHGDDEKAKTIVTTGGLSGATVIGYDENEKMITIALYREEGRLIDGDAGLQEVYELTKAGNFVPAATKGELTQFV